jgi:hypothetical protein
VNADHPGRSLVGQKYPKRLRLPAGKNTHEHMGRIVPGTDPSRFREGVLAEGGYPAGSVKFHTLHPMRGMIASLPRAGHPAPRS